MSSGLLYLNGAVVLLLLIEVSWLWARLLAAREEMEGHRRDAESLDRLCQQQSEAMDKRDREIKVLRSDLDNALDLVKKLTDEAIARDEEEDDDDDQDKLGLWDDLDDEEDWDLDDDYWYEESA